MDSKSDSPEVVLIDNDDSVSTMSTLIVDESSSTSFDNKSQCSEGSNESKNTSRKSTGSIQNMGRGIPLQSVNTNPSLNAKILTGESLKFMQNFDPSTSSRNQQKKKKRYHHNDGRLIQYADDYELCDCLRPSCTGCHFKCPSCEDRRCGHECRFNRKWLYESVEVEGTALEFRNPHYSSFT